MKVWTIFGALAVLVLLLVGCPNANPPQAALPPCGCTQKDPTSNCIAFPNGRCGFCADARCPTASELCSYLPRDIDAATGIGYDNFGNICQGTFDWFSWQTFVALNWPANPDGTPMNAPIGSAPAAPRVWESYEDMLDVFDPNPTPKGELKVLSASSKAGFHTFLGSDDLEPGSDKPLIDRNLNFVLYEVKLNASEVWFIKNNHLDTYCGQKDYYKTHNIAQFPQGSYQTDSVGAMEIKAAWRVLVPGVDDTTRFFKRRALITVAPRNTVNKKEIRDTVWVGLVGLHIIRQTSTNGDAWIWSSFEQVDNAPDCPNGTCPPGLENYSFYNPACTNCPLNTAPSLLKGDPSYLWSPASGAASPQYARRYAANGYGTQVGRINPVEASTMAISAQWQQKLKGTVWQYYKLIGSQWVSEENGKTVVGIPAAQANTAAETYLQVLNPAQGSGSCVSCHRFAISATGGNANFSFVLYHANRADSIKCK